MDKDRRRFLAVHDLPFQTKLEHQEGNKANQDLIGIQGQGLHRPNLTAGFYGTCLGCPKLQKRP